MIHKIIRHQIMISHSDSEIKDETRGGLKKQLKAKKKVKKVDAIRKLRNGLHPYWRDTRLSEAVYSNNTKEVKRLLELGICPNRKEIEMRSVLHVAVSRGFVDIVELLLKHGADPNKRDMLLNTPLHVAARLHNFSIISMLIDADADVSCLDHFGRNPIQLASSKLQLLQRECKDGTIEMIKLKQELQQVVDLLLSIKMKRKQEDLERLRGLDVDLQMMKSSFNSGSTEDMDDQMLKLLEGIQQL